MRNIKYRYLKEFIDLENHISLLKLNIKRSKRELYRWVEGDLQDVSLTEESRAARLEETIEDLKNELSILESEKEDLLQLIDSFTGIDHLIVTEKYIYNKSLEVIAHEHNYSYGYIKNKHAELVRKVEFLERWEENGGA